MAVIYFDKQAPGLNKPLNRCIEFAIKAEKENLQNGRYNLDDGIYCSIVETDSSFETPDFFEAHRKYVDLHYVIDGEFFLSVACTDKMQFDSYTEEKDFVKLFGKSYFDVPMNTGFALALFPNDAHIAKKKATAKYEKIKKIIFKIPIGLFEKN